MQAVGQREDHFAAVACKRLQVVRRPERMGEEILPARVGGEVVAAPVDDAALLVTLDQPVVARDAGAVEAGADDALLLQVLQEVDADHLLELRLQVGQPEDVMIKRRATGLGDKPVAAHARLLAIGPLAVS